MNEDFVFDFVHMSIDFVPTFALEFGSDSDEDGVMISPYTLFLLHSLLF